jgi:hypothetical protein
MKRPDRKTSELDLAEMGASIAPLSADQQAAFFRGFVMALEACCDDSARVGMQLAFVRERLPAHAAEVLGGLAP